MLHFGIKNGLYPDAVDELREGVREKWVAAFAEPDQPALDTGPETPAGQLIDSLTAFIGCKDAELMRLASQFNPMTNEGIWQEALGKIYFLERKGAEPTLVRCRCRGMPGLEIPGWSVVKTTENQSLIATAPARIGEDGTVDVIFRVYKAGAVPIGPHEVRAIVTNMPGWDEVDNDVAGVLGRDVEARAEFEARRAASVAANAHGSAASMYGTIANIPGVLHCKVLENTGPDPVVKWGVVVAGHSVLISVFGGDDAAIAEAVYRKKDAGCGTSGNTSVTWRSAEEGGVSYQYRIQRPEPTSIGVQVTVRKTALTPSTIVADIQNAVIADFNGLTTTNALGAIVMTPPRVSFAEKLYASRFITALVNAGVSDLISVKLAYPASNSAWLDQININADIVPVLAAEDVRVIMEDER